jgi:hypothetical protein
VRYGDHVAVAVAAHEHDHVHVRGMYVADHG